MNSNQGEDSGAAAGTAGMLAALAYIDGVGFHGIAADLTGPEPEIDRSWPALLWNALIAVRATVWPEGLQPAVERFCGAAEPVVAAVSRRDTAAAASAVHELHLSYHALSEAGWSHLAKVSGVPGRGGAHHTHGAGHGGHEH